jgi:multidrug transporter EmrE-like cation transporter
MFNLIPIAMATGMAFIDTIVLSGLKEYDMGVNTWRGIVPIAMLTYSLQPYIYLQALQHESMTVMNILWDIISDIMVTVMGLFYFKEEISSLKQLGLAFAFIGIVLMSYDEVSNESFSKKK